MTDFPATSYSLRCFVSSCELHPEHGSKRYKCHEASTATLPSELLSRCIKNTRPGAHATAQPPSPLVLRAVRAEKHWSNGFQLEVVAIRVLQSLSTVSSRKYRLSREERIEPASPGLSVCHRIRIGESLCFAVTLATCVVNVCASFRD